MSEYDARAPFGQPAPTSPVSPASPSRDADLATALRELSGSVAAFSAAVEELDRVVTRADGLLDRAEKLLAPLAATQQVGDQIKVAGQLAGQVASAAVKRGVAAARTVTGP
ncbi:hypothetical protein ACJ5H2_06370 [Nocardioides sp. R1-1]|uniref:hypothetical protein n=1 Tax=Nocardioides sp. R1-1 TaxID=3383502 RepID=UPI0038D1C925